MNRFSRGMLREEGRRLKLLWLMYGQGRRKMEEIEATINRLRSRAMKLLAGRRKKMLHKIVRIVVLNSKGSLVGSRELDELAFSKNGSMTVLPSRILEEFMAEVDKGGGIFIEKVWAT